MTTGTWLLFVLGWQPFSNTQYQDDGCIRAPLRASWITMFLGCIAFLLGMALLFWNEGRAIQTTRSLEEAMSAVVPLQLLSKPQHKNDGRLVHLTGPLDVGEPLTEVEYGVSVPAVKLKRRVQMYQWVEEKKQNRELEPREQTVTSYSYSTEWKDKLIDSNKFYLVAGHHNPKEFPVKSTVYISEQVNIGAFTLSPELKAKFTDFVLVTSDERPERRDIKMHSGLYYHSQDVWNPEVGDIRLQFSYAGKAGEVVSVVGMQVGAEVRPYYTSMGGEVLILRQGSLSMQDIFLQEHTHNLGMTWLLRVLSWLIMLQGTPCFTVILRDLLSRYSLLRDMLVMGLGSVNVAVSLSVALLVVGLAWLWYRPMFGISVGILAVLPFLFSAGKLYMRAFQDNPYQRLRVA